MHATRPGRDALPSVLAHAPLSLTRSQREDGVDIVRRKRITLVLLRARTQLYEASVQHPLVKNRIPCRLDRRPRRRHCRTRVTPTHFNKFHAAKRGVRENKRERERKRKKNETGVTLSHRFPRKRTRSSLSFRSWPV